MFACCRYSIDYISFHTFAARVARVNVRVFGYVQTVWLRFGVKLANGVEKAK